MGEHVIKMPDVGEGIAEAELVEWHVKVGDLVREDALLAAVMTDKATVEIPRRSRARFCGSAPRSAMWSRSDPTSIRLKVAGEEGAASSSDSRQAAKRRRPKRSKPRPMARSRRRSRRRAAGRGSCRRHVLPRRRRAPAASMHRPPTARAARGRQAACLAGRPPAGARGRASTCGRFRAPARPAASRTRISTPSSPAVRKSLRAPGLSQDTAVEDIKVIGLRRKIAEKMAIAQVAHPAHHLCRRGRCHRARGAAGSAQREQARRTSRS